MKISNLILAGIWTVLCAFTAWGFPYNLPAVAVGGIIAGKLLVVDIE